MQTVCTATFLSTAFSSTVSSSQQLQGTTVQPSAASARLDQTIEQSHRAWNTILDGNPKRGRPYSVARKIFAEYDLRMFPRAAGLLVLFTVLSACSAELLCHAQQPQQLHVCATTSATTRSGPIQTSMTARGPSRRMASFLVALAIPTVSFGCASASPSPAS